VSPGEHRLDLVLHAEEYPLEDLFDVNGDKIGTIDDVRYGDIAGWPKWIVVKGGLFGTKMLLVPAGEVHSSDEGLVVPFTKDQIKNAPGVHDEVFFTESEERQLCNYYGLDYSSSRTNPEEGCVESEG
jgi:hypothetical protein